MKCLYCNKELYESQNHWGLHSACFKQCFHVNDLYDFVSFSRKDYASQNINYKEHAPYLTSFFAGKFRKYEAKLNNISYVLKLGSNSVPEIAPVEYISNLIGNKLGIPVAAPFALIKGTEEFAFATKNFMPEISGHHDIENVKEFQSKTHNINFVEMITNVFILSEEMKDALLSLIKKRIGELDNELSY